MANTLFMSDPHIRHNNICKYRPFATIKEHDEWLADQWCSSVRKNDLVWVLGDSTFDEAGLEWFAKLPGNKHLIPGNHCFQKGNRQRAWEVFKDVRGLTKRYGFWLSHCPVHPQELYRVKANVHGHLHDGEVTGPHRERYYCVSPEMHDGLPVSLDQIRERIAYNSVYDRYPNRSAYRARFDNL